MRKRSETPVNFEKHAIQDPKVERSVRAFLDLASTFESENSLPINIFQDGVSSAYYAKVSLKASTALDLCDLNAKLDFDVSDSYRANRDLKLTNNAYLKMQDDAKNGREFNDINVEFNQEYESKKPLKVWGGQHRTQAITKGAVQTDRFHGFRVYFNLTKEQRTEVALISNTNIAVSNDTFDRILEETRFGDSLRNWCRSVGLLKNGEDFPDSAGSSERITVKKARSFIVNFYNGKDQGDHLTAEELDKNIYEPFLTTTGLQIDTRYAAVMTEHDIDKDESLREAGRRFVALHNAQVRAITDNPQLKGKKPYRNKALIESVLCGWSFVSGLLQNHSERLKNHYQVPKVNSKVTDPLNANEMATYKHELDKATYRGLGTRSSLEDRQRLAQLFLAKSKDQSVLLDKRFMERAISTLVGLRMIAKGYAK